MDEKSERKVRQSSTKHLGFSRNQKNLKIWRSVSRLIRIDTHENQGRRLVKDIWISK